MSDEQGNTGRLVGIKQVRRALASGRVKGLFLARDADPRLVRPLEVQADEQGIPVNRDYTMKALGRAFGIAVGAAVAAETRSAEKPGAGG